MNEIEIVNYSENWVSLFLKEKNLLEETLNNHIKKIHHIGSTAIPRMSAKPIVDILLVVKSIDEIDEIEKKLVAIGYNQLNRNVIPYFSFFTSKLMATNTFNCHIFEIGDPQIIRYLRFRDFLTDHPQKALAYLSLKKNLLKKVNNDLNQYVAGKNDFIRSIDKEAKTWQNKKIKTYITEKNKGEVPNQWDDTKITRAMEANFIVMTTHFIQYLPNVHFKRAPGYVLIDTGMNQQDSNLILDVHFPSSQINTMVGQLTDYFKKKYLPFTWWITPSCNDEIIISSLKKNQLTNVETSVALYIDLNKVEAQLDNPFTVVKITTPNQFDLVQNQLSKDDSKLNTYFSWISSIYTQEDPIQFYAFYLQNKLINCSAITYYAQLAGIYHLTDQFVSVDNSLKKMIICFLLNQAKKENYSRASLLSSKYHLSFYKKLGFIPHCSFQKWQNEHVKNLTHNQLIEC